MGAHEIKKVRDREYKQETILITQRRENSELLSKNTEE